jgi:hypothetical protein
VTYGGVAISFSSLLLWAMDTFLLAMFCPGFSRLSTFERSFFGTGLRLEDGGEMIWRLIAGGLRRLEVSVLAWMSLRFRLSPSFAARSCSGFSSVQGN